VAVVLALLPIYAVLHNSVDDPGLGAGLAAMMYAGFVIASLCVPVGFVTGWIGARRSRGSKLLARAGMALHGTILVVLAVVAVLFLVAIVIDVFTRGNPG
jgi:hypothetical protein